MNKRGLRLKQMAATAWKKEHPDKDPGPCDSISGLPVLLDVWVTEIKGKTFVAVHYCPPRSAPGQKAFYEFYEIATAPKVVKAKQAIKVTQPPPELEEMARRIPPPAELPF